MNITHLPTESFLAGLPAPGPDAPLRILFSACLSGRHCGYDGSSYGESPVALQLIRHPKVAPVLFCPEDFSFGTPRALCDIHGGNGFDVLDGKPRVCAALLIRNGIAVASQRDFHTLGLVMKKIDPDYQPEGTALDHHQIPWYLDYFGTGQATGASDAAAET